MHIDAHTQLGLAEGEMRAEDLLAMLDEYQMDRTIACPAVSGLTGSPSQVAAANDYLAATAKEHPQRITAFSTVNPYHEEAAWSEMERAAALGLKGLKLHPPLQGFVLGAHKLMIPIFERLVALEWPVIIHTGLRVAGHPYVMVSLQDVWELAKLYSSVPIVIAHMAWGGRDSQGIDRLARDSENAWFETSGVNHPNGIRAVAEAGAIDRIMFGSNYPYLNPAVEMLKIDLARFSEAERQNITGGNAARLLGV